jgi:hypothetical protein
MRGTTSQTKVQQFTEELSRLAIHISYDYYHICYIYLKTHDKILLTINKKVKQLLCTLILTVMQFIEIFY